VMLQDFSFTPYPTTATVAPGQTATYAMTLTPINGLSGTIQLGCQGAPSGGTCTVTPSSVTLANNYPAQISVSVSTGGRAMQAPHGDLPFGPGGSLRLWLELALSLALMALAGLKIQRRAKPELGASGSVSPAGAFSVLAARRLRFSLMLLAGLALMLMVWAACGGGGMTSAGGAATPAGNYSVTVTGSYSTPSGQASSLKESQTVTLQVN
jgi:hypothetical protein